MVRRGSTVRVRQRALQKFCRIDFSFFALLARFTACGRYGAPLWSPLGQGRSRGAEDLQRLDEPVVIEAAIGDSGMERVSEEVVDPVRACF